VDQSPLDEIKTYRVLDDQLLLVYKENNEICMEYITEDGDVLPQRGHSARRTDMWKRNLLADSGYAEVNLRAKNVYLNIACCSDDIVWNLLMEV
jgi:hypothetical protein